MTRQQAHEQTIAHLQRHRTREGTVIRLHRRDQAHSLEDELAPPRPIIEEVGGGWQLAGETLGGVLLMGGICSAILTSLFGVPTPVPLLFVVAGMAVYGVTWLLGGER